MNINKFKFINLNPLNGTITNLVFFSNLQSYMQKPFSSTSFVSIDPRKDLTEANLNEFNRSNQHLTEVAEAEVSLRKATKDKKESFDVLVDKMKEYPNLVTSSNSTDEMKKANQDYDYSLSRLEILEQTGGPRLSDTNQHKVNSMFDEKIANHISNIIELQSLVKKSGLDQEKLTEINEKVGALNAAMKDFTAASYEHKDKLREYLTLRDHLREVKDYNGPVTESESLPDTSNPETDLGQDENPFHSNSNREESGLMAEPDNNENYSDGKTNTNNELELNDSASNQNDNVQESNEQLNDNSNNFDRPISVFSPLKRKRDYSEEKLDQEDKLAKKQKTELEAEKENIESKFTDKSNSEKSGSDYLPQNSNYINKFEMNVIDDKYKNPTSNDYPDSGGYCTENLTSDKILY